MASNTGLRNHFFFQLNNCIAWRILEIYTLCSVALTSSNNGPSQSQNLQKEEKFLLFLVQQRTGNILMDLEVAEICKYK